jgi:ribonuclease E
MTKRMLIDASHAEETRVVVLDGNRLEDFDFETAARRQLKGNIYLAKVVRVEPSLQAAFVEYGGNRHGFLAFSEIHPDYYQIPIADRQRLLEMQAEEARREREEEDREVEAEASREPAKPRNPKQHLALETRTAHEGEADASESLPDSSGPPSAEYPAEPDHPQAQPLEIRSEAVSGPMSSEPATETGPARQPAPSPEVAEAESADESGGTLELIQDRAPEVTPEAAAPQQHTERATPEYPSAEAAAPEQSAPSAGFAQAETEEQAETEDESGGTLELIQDRASDAPIIEDDNGLDEEQAEAEEPLPETIGGEAETEYRRERRIPPRFLRQYKIQEVIHRRQILLVQVVKEERGTKGAALTTYISLAGRYCVLMPNSPHGGGISRKITSPADRRRLKEVIAELDLPPTMGLIIRTAGANRPKSEIKRDCEYLLRLWDDIREHTLRSIAPALIYEEANLIKRALRDLYSRDLDEVIVDGEAGWRAARDFMRMIMPSHASRVQLWRDANGQPLFARYQVDAQLDAILSPIVQLRSGGYLVINQAEALVAIDVNSGRSTRERNIEETALRTNLEAAEEVARQLRLRDLAGLIVIDFIDMEFRKHNGMVERRLKEALKADRARIQVGYISHFGLLEMSRQRLRPSFAETSLVICPHCGGTGHIRTVESAAIHVLRAIEEEGGKRRAAEIAVHTTPAIALYIFNHKRQRLAEIESRYTMGVVFVTQDDLVSPPYRIERVRAQTAEQPAVITPESAQPEAEAEEEEEAESEQAEEEAGGEESDKTRRRRRRRRRGRREEQPGGAAPVAEEQEGMLPEPMEGVPELAEAVEPGATGVMEPEATGATEPDAIPEMEPEAAEAMAESVSRDADERRGRRRRRRGRREEGGIPDVTTPGADQPDLPPLYAGPTPADPYGGQVFDIFDAIEEAESAVPPRPRRRAPEPTLPVIEQPPPSPEPITDVEPEPAMAETLPPPEPEPPEPPPAAANDSEPVIKPIIVGAEEEPVEKKRGWWRR